MAKDNSGPVYHAYTVVKREGADDWWCNIGGAFPHADGRGLNLVLQALPLDGKIVLRPPKDEADERTDQGNSRDTRSRTDQPRQRAERR